MKTEAKQQCGESIVLEDGTFVCSLPANHGSRKHRASLDASGRACGVSWTEAGRLRLAAEAAEIAAKDNNNDSGT